MPVSNLFLQALLAAAGAALNPAVAQTQTWALTQPFWPAGNAQLRLDGEASGALLVPASRAGAGRGPAALRY